MFQFVIIYSPIWIPAIILIALGLYFFLPQLVHDLGFLLQTDVSNILLYSLPFWLPVVLAFVFWRIWKTYIQSKYLYKTPKVLLEIKVPQEVLKSPLAMETFLMSLHQTGKETTFIDRNWKGQVRAIFSLEIVSIEGKVKFFIHALKSFKSLIESGLYSQYPNIEIHEVPDYAISTHFDPKTMDLYAIDYKLNESDAFPIKTYIDYGLDDPNVEEENKIDPINTIIENMAAIGPNQQYWLQIVIRAHKKEQKKHGEWFGKTDAWKDSAKDEIKKIRAQSLQGQDGVAPIKFPNPTKGEQERIYALERSVSKLSFDVGIRSIYMAKKEFFDGNHISGQRALLRSYSAQHLNRFSPTDWLDGYDYPWEDFMGIRKKREKINVVEAYKRRSFFFLPYIGEGIMVLNVEELASLFHVPGRVTNTPNLARIPSKKSEAPANLPI